LTAYSLGWPRRERVLVVLQLAHRIRSIAVTADVARSEQSTGVQLLADIRAVYAAMAADRLFSKHLTAHLNSLDDLPWSEFSNGRPLTKARLGRMCRAALAVNFSPPRVLLPALACLVHSSPE
jgi:hypothetical protein